MAHRAQAECADANVGVDREAQAVGLSEIARAEADSVAARAVLGRLLLSSEPTIPADIYEALRAWTWKALDQRRRDEELEQWHDIVSSVSVIVGENEPQIGAKIEALHELLGESLAAAAIKDTARVLQRQHVRSAIGFLSRSGVWMPRARLGAKLRLSQPNLTRIISLMISEDLIERRPNGKEVELRLSRLGLDVAAQLSEESSEESEVVVAQPEHGSAEAWDVTVEAPFQAVAHLAASTHARQADEYYVLPLRVNDDQPMFQANSTITKRATAYV